MKLKEIIGSIFMVLLTVIGTILAFGVPIAATLNSNGILNCMIKTDYLTKSQTEAEKILENYIDEDNAKAVLDNISVKSHIRELAGAFDNNTTKQKAEEITKEVKSNLLTVIDDQNISQNDKESFANTVAQSYMKTIFPVTEMSIISSIYSKYSEKVILAFCVLAALFIFMYFYLALGKKTYKWAIVALYNIIVLGVVVIILFGVLNSITIGNERTSAVILEMISQIKGYMLVYILAMVITAVISNYFAYFRKKKRSHT